MERDELAEQLTDMVGREFVLGPIRVVVKGVSLDGGDASGPRDVGIEVVYAGLAPATETNYQAAERILSMVANSGRNVSAEVCVMAANGRAMLALSDAIAKLTPEVLQGIGSLSPDFLQDQKTRGFESAGGIVDAYYGATAGDTPAGERP